MKSYPIYRRCFEEVILDTDEKFYIIQFEHEYEKQEEELELKVVDIYVEEIKMGGD